MDDLAPESIPYHVIDAMNAEQARLAAAADVRQRAQATGWCGPYRVQVPLPTLSVSGWQAWLDLPNTHDRLGTAFARCRALVHGLTDGVRPSWYGDQRRTLGTHDMSRVVDRHGRVVARAGGDQ
jgi:hypothetical protein